MTTRRYNLKDNQARAFNKMIRVSHQKLGLVIDTVRGLPASRAVDVLKFSKKRCAGEVLKTLLSGIANAENNHKLAADTLYVKEIWCGKAIVMKRIMPKKQGMAHRIEKPFSNLTIILESGAPAKSEKAAAKAEKKETKKETKKK
ncbi:MAG: 50S ribosomal protein L22 [Alphaproteobacteria bacterium]|nr:50S ribosomal protein L22 [Alphaproteobacteria bacterium]